MAFPSNPTNEQRYYQNGLWYKYSSTNKCWLKQLDNFVGATSITDGASGFIPQPTSGQQDYVLKGSGIFANPYYSTGTVLLEGDNASIGSSTSFARSNHRHAVGKRSFGIDLTTSAYPKGIFRDVMLVAGGSASGVNGANIPWVYSNIDEAERSLPFWLQKLTDFFKNLENDTQYDQLIGGIIQNSSIYNGYATSNMRNTDMDNNVTTDPKYYAECFNLIVGRNVPATRIYTMGFTMALVATTANNNQVYPFRIVYQTTRNQSIINTSFSSMDTGNSISPDKPRCTELVSPYLFSSGVYPIYFETITLEYSK